MKQFTILSVVQICICAILSALITIYFVFSLIQAGEFHAWHIGIGVLALLSYFLVYESVREARKEADR